MERLLAVLVLALWCSSASAQFTYQPVPGTTVEAMPLNPAYLKDPSTTRTQLIDELVAFIESADDPLVNPGGVGGYFNLLGLVQYFEYQSEGRLDCTGIGEALAVVVDGGGSISPDDATGVNESEELDCGENDDDERQGPEGNGPVDTYDEECEEGGVFDSYGCPCKGWDPVLGRDTNGDGEPEFLGCKQTDPDVPWPDDLHDWGDGTVPGGDPIKTPPDDHETPPAGSASQEPGPNGPVHHGGGGGSGPGGDSRTTSDDASEDQNGDEYLGLKGDKATTCQPVMVGEGLKVEDDVDLVVATSTGKPFVISRHYSGSTLANNGGFPWKHGPGWGSSIDGWFIKKDWGLGSPIAHKVSVTTFPLSDGGEYYHFGGMVRGSGSLEGRVYEPLLPSSVHVWENRQGTPVATASEPLENQASLINIVDLVSVDNPGVARYEFYDFSRGGFGTDPNAVLHGLLARTVDSHGNACRYFYRRYYLPLTQSYTVPLLHTIIVNGDSEVDEGRDAVIRIDWDYQEVGSVITSTGNISKIRVFRPGFDMPTQIAEYQYVDFAYGANTLSAVIRKRLVNGPVATVNQAGTGFGSGISLPAGWSPLYHTTATYYRYSQDQETRGDESVSVYRLSHIWGPEEVERLGEEVFGPLLESRVGTVGRLDTMSGKVAAVIDLLTIMDPGAIASAMDDTAYWQNGGDISGVQQFQNYIPYLADGTVAQLDTTISRSIEDYAAKKIEYYSEGDVGVGYASKQLAGRVKSELVRSGCGCAGDGAAVKINYEYQRRRMSEITRTYYRPFSELDEFSFKLTPVFYHSATIITESLEQDDGTYQPHLRSVQWQEDRVVAEGGFGFQFVDEQTGAVVSQSTKVRYDTNPFTVGNAVMELVETAPGSGVFRPGRTWFSFHEFDREDRVASPGTGTVRVRLGIDAAPTTVGEYTNQSTFGTNLRSFRAHPSAIAGPPATTPDSNAFEPSAVVYQSGEFQSINYLLDYNGNNRAQSPRDAFLFRSGGGLNEYWEYEPWERAWDGIPQTDLGRLVERGVTPVSDPSDTSSRIPLERWEYLTDEFAVVNVGGLIDPDYVGRIDLKSRHVRLSGEATGQAPDLITDYEYEIERLANHKLWGRVKQSATISSREGEYASASTPLASSQLVTSHVLFGDTGLPIAAVDALGTISLVNYHPVTGSKLFATRNAESADLPSGYTTGSGWGANAGAGGDPTFTTTYSSDITGLSLGVLNENGVGVEYSWDLDHAAKPADAFLPTVADVLSHQLIEALRRETRHVYDTGSATPEYMSRTVEWASPELNVVRVSTFSHLNDDELTRSVHRYSQTGLVLDSIQWWDLDDQDQSRYYTTRFEYDAKGRLTATTAPNGERTEMDYDVRDHVTQTRRGPVGDLRLTETVQYDYDWANDVQAVGDGNANRIVRYVGNVPGPEDRVTRTIYDWRNRARLAFTLDSDAFNPKATAIDNTYTISSLDHSDRELEQITIPGGDFAGLIAVLEDTPASGTDILDLSDLSALGLSGLMSVSEMSVPASRTRTTYSGRGLVSEVESALDPTSSSYEARTWVRTHHDVLGRAIAAVPSSGAVSKAAYDVHGRTLALETTDGGVLRSDGGSAIVLERSEIEYDSVYNRPLLTARHVRNHRPEVLLANNGLGSNPITLYSGQLYDEASRPTYSIRYGAFGKSSLESGATVPVVPATNGAAPLSSEYTDGNHLITRVAYDERGRAYAVSDEKRSWTLNLYDDLDRTIAVVENAAVGTGVLGSAPPPLATPVLNWDSTAGRYLFNGTWDSEGRTPSIAIPHDDARLTTFAYDAVGNTTKRVAHLPSQSDQAQVTEMVYGQPASGGFAGPSYGNSLSLHTRTIYPDDSEGNNIVDFAYNNLGEQVVVRDQRLVERHYERDLAGRVAFEYADLSNAPATVDPSINAIATEYDAYGRITAVTSGTASTPGTLATARNAIGYEYDDLGRIARYRQSLTDGSAAALASAPALEYVYADAVRAWDSSAVTTRLAAIQYPNPNGAPETSLLYEYGSDDDLDDRLERVTRLLTEDGSVSTPLATYQRLGVGTITSVELFDRVTTTPTVLTVAQLDRTISADRKRRIDAVSGPDWLGPTDQAEGIYPAWDQFGRLVRHAWVPEDFGAGASVPYAYLNHEMTYDTSSNRTSVYESRVDETSDRADWQFGYDGLDRLMWSVQGTAGSGGGFAPSMGSNTQRVWTLDEVGNWLSVGSGLGVGFNAADPFEPLTCFVTEESREHNKANEITEITGGVLGGEREYDDNGNLTEAVPASASGLPTRGHVYDAWNRLVRVVSDPPGSGLSNATVLGEYEYNGLHQRTLRRVTTASAAAAGGELDEERLLYHTPEWQLLVEDIDDGRTSPAASHATDRVAQQFWGLRGLGDALMRRLDAKTFFSEPGSPGENGYVESLNGKLRDELLDPEVFETLLEARVLIEGWREHYNTVRPHSSLGYRPPAPEAIAAGPPSAPGGPAAACNRRKTHIDCGPLRGGRPLISHESRSGATPWRRPSACPRLLAEARVMLVHRRG